ncbi:MAG: hypothetical protein M3133_09410, partial [Actinomycetota bacterium]|nr:hypothetical protein [Actinomycetota bacterium]
LDQFRDYAERGERFAAAARLAAAGMGPEGAGPGGQVIAGPEGAGPDGQVTAGRSDATGTRPEKTDHGDR